MLIELRCNIFKETIINFHKGLNVILGDNSASNSIGKSTLLMIVDFVFGGDTYITANNDVVQNNGDHEFKFCFEFSGKMFYFTRATATYKTVNSCDKKYNVISEMSISDYTGLLKEKYKIELPNISFRAIASLYMRVWGKDNYDLRKPLHLAGQKDKDGVIGLIKLFNKYEGIKALDEQIKSLGSKKQALAAATKNKYLPSTNKTAYKKNIGSISELNKHMEELKADVQRFSINLKELITKEILDLKNAKSQLVKQRDIYQNRLKRTRNNIAKRHIVLQGPLIQLAEYFPNVNLEKLKEVENFHSSISDILNAELRKVEKDLLVKIRFLVDEIEKTDTIITRKLNVEDAPTYTVNRIVELTLQIRQMEYENSLYDDKLGVTNDLASAKKDLMEIKAAITSDISSLINTKMYELNKLIHTDGRRAPVFEIKEESYNFRGFDDKGTGKAYSNLLTFDLAVFRLTDIPILVHDTLLFKNIENQVIENIVGLYNGESKQVIIAIDEVNKFNTTTQEILDTKSVIKLSKTKLLFTKDWKK